ncbi:MAG: radical SAM protein [Candidatus Omnitrophica bacterium]|nr:radical SAM protein [Candidatus Omnitrophota bacterium]
MYPSYLNLYHDGILAKITGRFFSMLGSCVLCPRKCKVNRLHGENGMCRTALNPKVYSYMVHHGEEPPISGSNGSGTIFFSNCTMGCVYCQNYEFSQLGGGREVDCEELAGFMLELQSLQCHNINFVTPTHVIPQILKALLIAIPKGLKIPLVYNTGGYERSEVIKLLEGIVDIYLPDMRYADANMARTYSCVEDYPGYNQEAVKEMYRQVGRAVFDGQGILTRGMIIRHLVLPGSVSGTEEVMRFIAKELSKESYISLMSQYNPYYKSAQLPQYKDIARRLSIAEYQSAQQVMEKLGLENGWVQESRGLEKLAGIHIKPR